MAVKDASPLTAPKLALLERQNKLVIGDCLTI
jgi:hypothetical protein